MKFYHTIILERLPGEWAASLPDHPESRCFAKYPLNAISALAESLGENCPDWQHILTFKNDPQADELKVLVPISSA